MRLLLFSLLSLITVSSALECYVGKIPWGWCNAGGTDPAPVLKECAADDRCCIFSWAGGDDGGKVFDCHKDCPEFEEKQEVNDQVKMDGSTTYCKKAEGKCTFNACPIDS